MATVGSYSSLQMIAGAAMLGNVNGPALRSNIALGALVEQYDIITQPIYSSWQSVVAQLDGASSAGTISEDTVDIVEREVAGNKFISIFVGVLPGNGNVKLSSRWQTLWDETNKALNFPNVQNKIDPVYSVLDGFVTQTNQRIFTTVNGSNASSEATYVNQNNVSTGGLSQVTLSAQLFAQDVVNLGTAIDLENLNNLGSPEALLKQIAQVTRIATPLYNALVLNGIPQNTVDTILASNLSDREQKIVYRVMETITGSVLTEILGVLNVRTEKIETLADLLNPVKAFPNSYLTLTAPTVNGLRGIYIGTTSNINSNLESQLPLYVLKPLDGLLNSKNTYASLQKIIPPDQALAWKALQAGLESVTSIQDTIFSLLGVSTPRVETMKDLDKIGNLTVPIPSSVVSYFTQNNLGSGPYGSYTIGDGLGVIAAAGYDEMEEALPIIEKLINSDTVAPLIGQVTPNGPNYGGGLFSTISSIVSGSYGNSPTVVPSGQYGSGTYSNIQIAMDNLIADQYNGILKAINDLTESGGDQLAKAQKLMAVVQNQILNQESIMNLAGISFSEISAVSNVVAESTWNQLPSYALETTRWDGAWFYQQIAANTYANCKSYYGLPAFCSTTLGGQAVLGTLRESRNNDRLATAALLTNITVSDANPQPEPAKLANAQYTVNEAANLKVN